MNKKILFFSCVLGIIVLHETIFGKTKEQTNSKQNIENTITISKKSSKSNLNKSTVSKQNSSVKKQDKIKQSDKPKRYKLSNVGKNNIKKHEACKLTAYWDSNGYSIGYGHHGKDVYAGMKISQMQADKYFNKDIVWVEDAVNRLINNLPIKHNFSQNFVDGLGDLVYNCGEGGVKKSEFYNRLKHCRKNNNDDIRYSIAAIKNCCISQPGHITRRQEIMSNML